MQPFVQVNSCNDSYTNSKSYLNANTAIGDYSSKDGVFGGNVHCEIKIKDAGFLILDTGSTDCGFLIGEFGIEGFVMCDLKQSFYPISQISHRYVLNLHRVSRI